MATDPNKIGTAAPGASQNVSAIPNNTNPNPTATPLGGGTADAKKSSTIAATNNNSGAMSSVAPAGGTTNTGTNPHTNNAQNAWQNVSQPAAQNTTAQTTTQPIAQNTTNANANANAGTVASANQQTATQPTTEQTASNPADAWSKVNTDNLYVSDWDKQNLDADQMAKVLEAKKLYAYYESIGDKEGMANAHAMAENARAGSKYSGGADGSEYNPWDQSKIDGLKPADQLSADLTNRLQDIYKAGIEQQNNQIDYNVQQATDELQRAWEDAQAEFRTRQNQVDTEEAVNKDNAALYAEMRGDRGGIGQDQYTDVMNTAAINRQTIQSEQTKLSTDTARQIADLRAQGEFQKADALLQLTQTYLTQLLELEQFAANYGLSVAQFNESVREFEQNYALSAAQITGTYNGQDTYEAQQDKLKWSYQLAQDSQSNAQNVLNWYTSNGLKITDDIATAAGYPSGFADIYNAYLAAQTKASSGGYSKITDEKLRAIIDDAQASGFDPETWLTLHASDYGIYGKDNLNLAKAALDYDIALKNPSSDTGTGDGIDFNNLTAEDINDINDLVESGEYTTAYAVAKALGASDSQAKASQSQYNSYFGN